MNPQPRKPRRLSHVFQSHDAPVYFVTLCTFDRQPLLATHAIHAKLCAFARKSEPLGVAIGRYVIMPDHIHVFIRMAPQHTLGTTVRLLKRSLSAAIGQPLPHWQPGFFDHLLRHGESYSEKWDYVVQNPVRAGLVRTPGEWPFQGEIVSIRY